MTKEGNVKSIKVNKHITAKVKQRSDRELILKELQEARLERKAERQARDLQKRAKENSKTLLLKKFSALDDVNTAYAFSVRDAIINEIGQELGELGGHEAQNQYYKVLDEFVRISELNEEHRPPTEEELKEKQEELELEIKYERLMLVMRILKTIGKICVYILIFPIVFCYIFYKLIGGKELYK